MQSDTKTVEDYMKDIPMERRAALEELRALCLEILEGYEEKIQFGMPSYKQKGLDVEVAFASQKQYISLYILKQEVLDKFRDTLQGLSLGKGCIRYRKPDQIDFQIVRDLLKESRQSSSKIC
jgi:uncharacterized protein YdhG (YjbR/CyaY superfamily)